MKQVAEDHDIPQPSMPGPQLMRNDLMSEGESSKDSMARCLADLEAQLRRAYLESTRAFVAAVEARDAYTYNHSRRVEEMCRAITRELDMEPSEAECIATAARLHDIGKIGIPDAILTKPGHLTDDEFEVVKRHPGLAVGILGHTTHLHRELPLILHHHERVDGGGYPGGLRGEDIPFGARVLAVADALDAMLSRRSYKPPLSLRRARMELVWGRNRQFDPKVVDATLRWLASPTDPLAQQMRSQPTSVKAHQGD